jgi:hypothetical protein
VTRVNQSHADRYERVAAAVDIRASEGVSAAKCEKLLEAFVAKQISIAGAVADLSDEQRGYIKGFALGVIACTPLPAPAADRILAPIFGDDFFAKSSTTVRLSG